VALLLNLSIRTKLAIVLGLLVLAIAATGGVAANRMAVMNAVSDQIQTHELPSLSAAQELKSIVFAYRVTQARHVMNTDGATIKAIEAELVEQAGAVTQARDAYAAFVATADDRAGLEAFDAGWASYLEQTEKLLGLSRRNVKKDARTLFDGGMGDTALALQQALDARIAASRSVGEASVLLAQQAYTAGVRMMIGATLVAVLLALGGLLVLTRGIARPILALTGSMRHLADDQRDVDIPGLDRRDEIGAMAQTVQVFKDNAQRKHDLEQARGVAESERAARVQRLEQLIGHFDSTASAIMTAVTGDTAKVNSTARELSGMASTTSARATASASAASQTAANVATVAAATEELSASSREIGSQIGTSTDVARQAVAQAKSTTQTMAALSEAAKEIGAVVELINIIAEQTNLLALNATIEAARAGEAGKGFAVVASEVKNLAGQTSTATNQIADKIGAMQQIAAGAVAAIDQISRTIAKIDGVSSSVASSVEQQHSATQEIARSVNEAARGTDSVTANIADVTETATVLDQAAERLMQVAEGLSARAESMDSAVRRFLDDIRAA
jgi:methyl-accepting chemotaxis protein